MRAFWLLLALTLVPLSRAAADPGEMTFRYIGDPRCRGECTAMMLAEGDITYSSVERFKQVAAGLPRGVPIVLNSGGGNVLGSMLLGVAFRERGAIVLVPKGALCASACTYAFLGGVVRGVPAGAKLGVHKFYLADQAPTAVLDKKTEADTTALLRRYVAAMGANPELIALAGSVSPSRMHFLTPAELRLYRVVTGSGSARRGAPERRRPALVQTAAAERRPAVRERGARRVPEPARARVANRARL